MALSTRLTTTAKAASRRLRPQLWSAVQAAAAVTVSWYFAHEVLGHPEPIFAPVAAAVVLGAGRVMRGQRALQLIGGVTLGIGIGSGVGAFVGNSAGALGLAALLAMCVAIAIGGGFTGSGVMFINQASVSAILVIGLQLPGGWAQRLIEALVGGGVAAVIAVLLFPAARLPLLREAAQRVFAALHAALEHLDDLVTGRALVEETWMLSAGERIYEQLGGLIAARLTAGKIVRLAPRWWRTRSAVRTVDDRLAQLNLLGNAVLSLLRRTVGGLGVEPALPAQLRAAIHQLAAALGALAEDAEAGASEAMAAAARAARLADEAPCGPGTDELLIASMIQDCVRDLCRVVGAEPQ